MYNPAFHPIFIPMIKRLFIALLFFSAFAVIMAHSVIPHHHHVDETATEHYDKDHHDDDNDNGLDNLFSHFQHFSVDNQFASTHQLISVKQIDIPQPDISFTTSYNFYFCNTGEPVPILFPDPPDIYTSSGSAAFCLRGPPTFTV